MFNVLRLQWWPSCMVPARQLLRCPDPQLPCVPARLPSLPLPQVYELKKDEIDGAINKLRTQATGLYDKHLHKVRGGLGCWWCVVVVGCLPRRARGSASRQLQLPTRRPALFLPLLPCLLQYASKIPRYTAAKPAESSSDRKEE